MTARRYRPVAGIRPELDLGPSVSIGAPMGRRIALRRAVVVVVSCLVAAIPVGGQDRNWRAERERMVREQIEARGVRDPDVLNAMRTVRRERFVPSRVRNYATADSPLPIGHSQTISQPYIVAYMTELLRIERNHKVLEIGTGSGYQTAVLARLTDLVYSMEVVPELAERAEATLRRLGYQSCRVRHGDGYAGWPQHAPFDRILLTAAPLEVPQPLLDQLARGGRLVAPVGPTSESQNIVLITKDAGGRIRRQRQLAVRFVPMVRAEDRN